MQPTVLGSKRIDYAGGFLMTALGLAVIVLGHAYPVGSLAQMGPGFFPLTLGIILTVLGLAIALFAKPAAVPAPGALPAGVQWRGWLCIALGILAFIAFGMHGGLVPATFAIVFISALGDKRNTPVSAGLLALGTVAVAVIVFWWALHISFSLFHW